MINIGNVEKLSIFCKDIDTYSKLKEFFPMFLEYYVYREEEVFNKP